MNTINRHQIDICGRIPTIPSDSSTSISCLNWLWPLLLSAFAAAVVRLSRSQTSIAEHEWELTSQQYTSTNVIPIPIPPRSFIASRHPSSPHPFPLSRFYKLIVVCLFAFAPEVAAQLFINPDVLVGAAGQQVSFTLYYPSTTTTSYTVTLIDSLGNSLPTFSTPAAVMDLFTQTVSFTMASGVTFISITHSPAGSSYDDTTIYTNVITNGATITPPVFGGGTTSTMSGYRNGDISVALFNQIGNCVTNMLGTVMYIPDTGNNVIRRWDLTTNQVDTFWGPLPTNDYTAPFATYTMPGKNAYSTTRHPTIPDLSNPHSVVISSDGKQLYVSDLGACNVRVIDIDITTGDPTRITQITVGGAGDACPAASAWPSISQSPLLSPGAMLYSDGLAYPYLYVIIGAKQFDTSPGMFNVFTPVLVCINLTGPKTVSLMTSINSTQDSTGLYAYDSQEGADVDDTKLGSLGHTTFMRWNTDRSLIYLMSQATSDGTVTPSILRVFNPWSRSLTNAVSWYYSPTDRYYGSVQDGFPDNNRPSSLSLIGYVTAMTITVDSRYMYFLDSGSTASTFPRDFNNGKFEPVYCSLPSYNKVDCDTTLRRLDLLTGEVVTLAGGHAGSSDGVGTEVGFWTGNTRYNAPMNGKVTGVYTSLLMHPSNKYLYIMEGTQHSRIRTFDLATNSVRTVAGGGGIANAPRSIFGVRNGKGINGLFASPHQVVAEKQLNQYLYVTDAYAISKIDLLSGSVTKVFIPDNVQGTADSNMTGQASTEKPLLHMFFPIISDPTNAHILWGFRFNGNENVTPWQKFYRIDTTTPPATVTAVSGATNGYYDKYWAPFATASGPSRVQAGCFDPSGRYLWLADFLADQVSGDFTTKLLKIDFLSRIISPLPEPLTIFTDIANWGTFSSIVFDSTGSNLYACDIAATRILQINPSNGASIVLAGALQNALYSTIMLDGTGSGAFFSFSFNAQMQREQAFPRASETNSRFMLEPPLNGANDVDAGNFAPNTPRGRFDMVIDPTNSYLYVNDVSNRGFNVLRRITIIGTFSVVETIAGKTPLEGKFHSQTSFTYDYRTQQGISYESGTGSDAGMTAARSLAMTNTGIIYMADTFFHHLRAVIPDSVATPFITGVSPTIGVAPAASATIILTGYNLNLLTGATVFVGGVQSGVTVTMSSPTPTSVVINFPGTSLAPAGVAYQFRVNVNTVNSVVSTEAFTYLDPAAQATSFPTIRHISPSIGTGTGSYGTLTLVGTNLGNKPEDFDLTTCIRYTTSVDTATVKTASNVAWWSSTKMTFQFSTSETVGVAYLKLYLRGSASPIVMPTGQVFTFNWTTPAILNLSPQLGTYSCTGGAQRLTLDGTNFPLNPSDYSAIYMKSGTGSHLGTCSDIQPFIHPLTNRTTLTCLIIGLWGQSTTSYVRVLLRNGVTFLSPSQLNTRFYLSMGTIYYKNRIPLLASALYVKSFSSRGTHLPVDATAPGNLFTGRFNGFGDYLDLNDPNDNLQMGTFPAATPGAITQTQQVMPTRFGGPGTAFTFTFNIQTSLSPPAEGLRVLSCRSGTSGPVADDLSIYYRSGNTTGVYGFLEVRLSRTISAVEYPATLLTHKLTSTIIGSQQGFSLVLTSDGILTMNQHDASSPHSTSVSLTTYSMTSWSGVPTAEPILLSVDRHCVMGKDLQTPSTTGAWQFDKIQQVAFWPRALRDEEIKSVHTVTAWSLGTVSIASCGGASVSTIDSQLGVFNLYISVPSTSSTVLSIFNQMDYTDVGYIPHKLTGSSGRCSTAKWINNNPNCLVCQLIT